MARLKISDAEYFARPELSASGVKLLLLPGGPERFAWQREHGQPPKRVFDVGHAAHTLVLGVGDPIERYPDEVLSSNGLATTNAAKAWATEARERGVTPLTPSDYAMVHLMAGALVEHPRMHELRDAECEVTLTGEIFGVPFRGKLDAIHAGGAQDYKTTKALADVATFGRTAYGYGYHVQHVVYAELLRQNGVDDPDFEFVVQEKDAPHLAAFHRLDDDAVRLGWLHLERACQLWLGCTESGEWPGYPTETQTVTLPSWATRELEDHLDQETESAFADFLKGFTL